MKDMTDDFRRHGARHPNDKPQVIYMTDKGDYCRETGPSRIRTHDDAAAWARDHFCFIADSFARNCVTAFRVEWF